MIELPPTRFALVAGDPVQAAQDLVEARFPAARWALLAGSVLTDVRTPTSDLDIVVLLPDGPPAPFRESLLWQGCPAELFVYDRPSLARYLEADYASRRPILPRMCAESIVLCDQDASVWGIREDCSVRLHAGPAPLTNAELEQLRYFLTDLLDDLVGSRDPGETAVIAWTVLVRTAELALSSARHWVGGGKWLVRELRHLDDELADRLLSVRNEPTSLIAVADEVLNGVGGRLWAGYRAAGDAPEEPASGEEPLYSPE